MILVNASILLSWTAFLLAATTALLYMPTEKKIDDNTFVLSISKLKVQNIICRHFVHQIMS